MTDPDHKPRDQATTRLVKYLPMMMIGHLLIAVPTVVISIALAYATFVQADATRKIQQSETWPFVSFGTGNATPEGLPEITLSLTNDGVGPAKLQAMELVYAGKSMPTAREFLRQCCAGEEKLTFMSEPVSGVLRPGQQRNFIRLRKAEKNAAIWDRLDSERWKVRVRSCYCSIFDDCWISDSRDATPRAVEVCPADWVQFEERELSEAKGSTQN